MNLSSQPDNKKQKWTGCLAALAHTLCWLVLLVATLWAYGALYFDAPLGSWNPFLAFFWLAGVVACLVVIRSRWKRLLAWAACFLAVLLPWFAKRPSDDREWAPEYARAAWTEIDGDRMTIHNFRNFDYGPDGSVTERWEDRVVHLSNLQGLDYFHNAWGGDTMAHPLPSFDFGPDGHVTISIETRREVGESYSNFGGLYKMYELIYLVGDERDFIKSRTNVLDEPVYLYRIEGDAAKIREGWDETLAALNGLKEKPRWYNVITHNCTTSLRAQTPVEKRKRFDIRLLLNGKLDELIYERGGLVTGGLPFPDLRKQALINEAAQAAQDDPERSRRIREGRVGFE